MSFILSRFYSAFAQDSSLRFDRTSFLPIRSKVELSENENSKQVIDTSPVGKPNAHRLHHPYLYQINRPIVKQILQRLASLSVATATFSSQYNEKGTLYFFAFLDELKEPDAWNADCSSNLAGIVLVRPFVCRPTSVPAARDCFDVHQPNLQSPIHVYSAE